MGINNVRSITDPIEPGTISVSRSITDEEPDVYVHGEDSIQSREEFEADQARRLSDPYLSPSDKADILQESGPEETLEELLARVKD